jgi:hypothetical protein
MTDLFDRGVYGSRTTKRHRAGKTDVEARRQALYRIVFDQKPMTVRQVFYRATVANLVPKTEQGYRQVQHDLSEMRRDRVLPYGWLVDNTRWQRKPLTFSKLEDALHRTASTYRKSVWADSDVYIEIWLEKDALSGVIFPITARYDVPLMTARGYASLSFLNSSAETIAGENAAGKSVYIYHFGDFDPSGQDAARHIEEQLRELSDDDFEFERIAVTPHQIKEWELPTRPNKASDPRARKFEGKASVELDAIEPDMLRSLVEDVILRHVDEHELDVLKTAEESEREVLKAFMDLVPQAPNENVFEVSPNGQASLVSDLPLQDRGYFRRAKVQANLAMSRLDDYGRWRLIQDLSNDFW